MMRLARIRVRGTRKGPPRCDLVIRKKRPPSTGLGAKRSGKLRRELPLKIEGVRGITCLNIKDSIPTVENNSIIMQTSLARKSIYFKLSERSVLFYTVDKSR